MGSAQTLTESFIAPENDLSHARAHVPIFLFSDYREYFRYIIEVRANVKGIRTRLASAAACQPSYLTQVLAGTAGFSLDQLHGIRRYLELGDNEWEYLRELGILDRAGVEELKEDCLERLRRLRNTWEGKTGDGKGAKAKGANKPTPEDVSWYVATWQTSALSAALHSTALRTPQALAKALDLPLARVTELLQELQERGFAEERDGVWANILVDSLYLGSGALRHLFRSNWFLRGHGKLMQGYNNGCQTGGVFCMSRDQYEALKTRVKSEFRKFFSGLPLETDGDVVVHYAIDLFEA